MFVEGSVYPYAKVTGSVYVLYRIMSITAALIWYLLYNVASFSSYIWKVYVYFFGGYHYPLKKRNTKKYLIVPRDTTTGKDIFQVQLDVSRGMHAFFN